MSRIAAPIKRRATPAKAAAPRPRGDARAAARRHLEQLATSLGWTSVELERHRVLAEAAHAPSARAEARAAFDAKLHAWSKTALERRPEPVESARLTPPAELAQLARDEQHTGAATTPPLA